MRLLELRTRYCHRNSVHLSVRQPSVTLVMHAKLYTQQSDVSIDF